MAELLGAGVTHVIDCRAEVDDTARWLPHPQVRYQRCPVDELGEQLNDSWFDAGVRLVQPCLERPDSLVLLHCHAGINRSPSLAFAVLIAQGVSPGAAMDQIRTARPSALAHHAERALAWCDQRARLSKAEHRERVADLLRWRQRHPISPLHLMGG